MGEEWTIGDLFNRDYLHFYEPRLTQQSDEQAALIWDLLGLREGSKVLDLACGHGRIANRLAERGAQVTGLDATVLFLDLAREDARRRGMSVEYVQGDMRHLSWTGEFDAVVSWFTAYGYFDDEQNRDVLARIRDAVREGGRFLVELNHKDGLLPQWSPSVVERRGDDLQIDENVYDPSTGRANARRTIVRDGEVREVSFFMRLFSF